MGKMDWKMERAYEILGIPLYNGNKEFELKNERIGEMSVSQFEQIVKEVSFEWESKVYGLAFDYDDCMEYGQRKALREKAFVPYEDFLKLHQLTFLDWKDSKYIHVDFKAPDFVWQDEQEHGITPAPYLHPDFHRYFRKFITNKASYDNFCYTYPPTIKGYLKLLAQSNVKKLNSFFLHSKIWCCVKASDRAKHTYITGSSGSGKSELIKFITYSEIKKEHRRGHVVLIDPNGDLAEQTVQMALVEGVKYEDIIYFDPFLDEDFTPCINPLQTTDTTERNIDRLGQELCRVFSSILKADAGLSTQMEALFTPCVATLLREGHSSFIDLQDFVDSEDIAAPYLDLGKESPFAQHRRFFENKFNDNSYRATKMSIYTKLQSLLNSSVFVNITTGRTTIDLFKILNEKKPKLIIFKLSKGSMGSEASEAFGRFVLGLISVLALQRDGLAENDRVPVSLTVDEFQNYVGGKILKEGLTELRKYKIAYTLACQYPNQIDTDTQDAVFANTTVKIVGQQQDPKNIALLSRTLSCEPEEIKGLKVGNFIGKVGETPSFSFSVPDTVLNTHNKLSEWKWNEFIDYQLEHYYQQKGDVQTIFEPEMSEEQEEHKAQEPQPKAPLFTDF